MSYRGAPLGVRDYVREMDEKIRKLTANAGTTRVPSQRIGDYIVEIEDTSGDPLIKLTEVATGLVTYCCQPTDDTDCWEVPPFTWYGVVDAPERFPGYPMPRQATFREVAVVQGFSADDLTIEILLNDVMHATFIAAPNSFTFTQAITPVTAYPNDVVAVSISNVVTGTAENVTIVIRTCPTFFIPEPS